MRILLDENFQLALYRWLRTAGHEAEHIIVLRQHGLPDASIRQRLATEELVFLTNDDGFADVGASDPAVVVISRVRQARPIGKRVEIWARAVEQVLALEHRARLYEILDSGELVPCTTSGK